MDYLDMQLVELLLKDAHRSSAELARQLNVSAPTIRRRINNLLKQKKIHIVALPIQENIGWPVTASVALNVASNKVKSVLKTLSDHQQVRWVAATSGRFDIMISMWLSSNEELYEFIENHIANLEGVLQTESFIALHTEKSL